MKKVGGVHIIVGGLLMVSLGLIGTSTVKSSQVAYEAKKPNSLRTSITKVSIEELIPRIENIKIVSVGDIMMHDIQISGGYNQQTQSYKYDYMFDKVKSYVADGDITVGNLELTMAGEENGGYTGYPCFNSPDSLAAALKNIGIDVLTTANNHSLDRRYNGVVNTIKVLDNLGIAHTGTFESQAKSQEILIKDVKDTKIAFLAYTYGTNGINPDKGKEYCVNYIDKDKIKAQIKAARAQGAEIICVSPHYGQEYIRQPNSQQKELVDFLVEQGVDVILGGHPHVLQPVEIRETTYDGKPKQTVVLYSQGNFVSAQRTRYREQSAIFDINLKRNYKTGEVTVEKVDYRPIWVDQTIINGKYNFRVLPAKKSIYEYGQGTDPLLSGNDYTLLKRALSDTREVLQTDDTRIAEEITYK